MSQAEQRLCLGLGVRSFSTDGPAEIQSAMTWIGRHLLDETLEIISWRADGLDDGVPILSEISTAWSMLTAAAAITDAVILTDTLLPPS